MLARLLSATAVLVTCAAACGPPPAPAPPPVAAPPPPPLAAARKDGLLPDLATPLAYAVELEIDPARSDYRGTVRVDVDVRVPTAHLVLRAGALSIDAATLRAGPATVPATARRRPGFGGDELVLAFGRTVAPGRAQLEVRFQGRIGRGPTDGLVAAEVPGAPPLAYAPRRRRGREPFPAFDDATLRAPIALSVQAPREATVVTTATVERTDDRGDRVIHHFGATTPLAPHNLALLVGPLDVTAGTGDAPAIRVLTPRGGRVETEPLLELARALVTQTSDQVGGPWPHARLDVLLIRPEMLTPDDTTLGAGLVAAGPNVAAKATPALPLAAAIASQWFGVAVSGVSRDDRWLDRGAAAWLGARALEHAEPGRGARVAAWRASARAMDVDALSRSRPLRGRDPGPDDWTADDDAKAGALFATLAASLGDDAVLAALRGRAHGPAVAPSGELLAEIDRATGRDASRLMTGYLDAPGVPEISVHLTCDPRRRWHAQISDEPFAFMGGRPDGETDTRTWIIPACVVTSTGERECAELSEGAPSLVAGRGCPTELNPNPSLAYYRFHISKDKSVKPARERVALDTVASVARVSNALSSFRSGKLAPSGLLEALAAADDSDSAEIAREVMSALESLADLAPTDTRAKLRAFADARFSQERAKIGWEPKTEEPRERRDLRAASFEAAARFSDDEDLARDAAAHATRWLAGTSPLAPDVAVSAIAIGARGKGLADADALLRSAVARGPADASIAARALAMSADAAVLERVLESLLTGSLGPRVLLDTLVVAARSPDARRELDGWLRARWGAVVARLGEGAVRVAAEVVRRSCDEAEAKQRTAWYTARARELGAGRAIVALAAEEATVCVELRARLGPALSRALAAPPKAAQPRRK